VRGAEVLVANGGEGIALPTLAELGAADARHELGWLGGRLCYALALEPGFEPPAGMGFQPLRPLASLLDEERFRLVGRGVQLVEWEETHRFCGRCATPTEPARGERAKRCPACGLLAFPRVAPAVIVRVTRGDRILLARGRRFPEPIYSLLAGFVDPGESLEEAVVREVREEVGVAVDDVRYLASQPWPFPHSLMVGFDAVYAGGELELEEEEIVDAGWFRAEGLPRLPPAFSIARRIIDEWVETKR
jgi:NAD+ diphosphatase